MRSTHSEHSEAFFTPGQIYVASCLGSPLAAAWFMASNHRALQHPEQVGRAVGLGLAATLVVATIALVLPAAAPAAAWPFLYSVGSYLYARRIFGTAVATLGVPTRRGAWWRVVLISCGFFLVLVAALAALALVFPGLFGSKN